MLFEEEEGCKAAHYRTSVLDTGRAFPMYLPVRVLCGNLAIVTSLPPATWDVCGLLEREMQGRMSPFLSGRRGAFYFGGVFCFFRGCSFRDILLVVGLLVKGHQ